MSLYHDWAEQATAALQLDRLNKHISEIGALIGPAIASHGHSRSTFELMQYHNNLLSERKELKKQVNATGFNRLTVDFQERA